MTNSHRCRVRGMKHLLFLAVLMAASLSGACDSLPQFQSPIAPAPTATATRLADFTVVAKRDTPYNPPNSKRAWYMTMVFAGVERESSVSMDCYQNTQIGRVAGPDCR